MQDPPDAPATDLPRVPYRGIRPFRYADHAIFFAREAETQRLLSLVRVYRGVMLYGDSGAGKSSLLNAGLIPEALALGFSPERLRVQPRAGEELVVERIATTDDPSAELLPSRLAPDDASASRAVLSIDEFSARVDRACVGGRPLLIFDQFEELVTLFESPEARATQHALVALLVDVLHGSAPVKILLSFRDDYLGRVRELLVACPELSGQGLRVAPPRADTLPTIISGPFDRHPGQFAHPLSPELTERLVATLSEHFGSGELSLSGVQTVCLRLWQSPDPDALLDAKGPQGVLEDYLGEAIETMPATLRPAAIQILSEMVTAAGTRNVISASDLFQRVREQGGREPDAMLAGALDHLSDSRLVNRERRRDIDLYEITSEFLVPWITQRREELHRAQERQRELRRFRVLGAIAGVLLIIVAVVAGLAVWALGQRSHANTEATTARSLALAADGRGATGDQLGAGLLLSLAALTPYRAGPASPLSARNAMIGTIETAGLTGLAGVLTTPQGSIDSIAFSPSGAILAVGMSGGSVRLYNAATHRLLKILAGGNASAIDSLALSGRGALLAAGSADGDVRLWNLSTGQQAGELVAERRSAVRVLAFSSNGRLLAAGLDNGEIRSWNVATHAPAGPTLISGPGPRLVDTYANLPGVDGLGFIENGSVIVASEGGVVNRLFLWNVRTGRRIGPALNPSTLVQSMAVSPDGRSVAIGTDGAVEEWTIAGRPRLRATVLTPSSAIVGTLAFSADGREIGAGDDTGNVYVWKLRSRHPTASLTVSAQDLVDAVTFRPDTHELAVGDSGGTVTLWNPSAAGFGPTLHSSADVRELAFSARGNRIAAIDSNGHVSVWNGTGGKPLLRRQDNDDNGSATLAFNPQGTELADIDSDRRVTIWSVPSGTRIATLPALRNSSVASLAVVTPDLRTLIASDNQTRVVRLWRLPSGASLQPIVLPKHETPDALAVDAGGRQLAIGTTGGTIWLWQIGPRPQERSRLTTSDNAQIDQLAFSASGRTLAEISDDATARVLNLATGRQIGSTITAGATLNNPDNGGGASVSTGGVNLAISPDGRLLVTSDQSSVRLWDVATSAPLGPTIPRFVEALAFSPGGHVLATGMLNGVGLWSSFLWPALPQLRGAVCTLTGGDLTRAEWTKAAPGIPYQEPCR